MIWHFVYRHVATATDRYTHIYLFTHMSPHIDEIFLHTSFLHKQVHLYENWHNLTKHKSLFIIRWAQPLVNWSEHQIINQSSSISNGKRYSAFKGVNFFSSFFLKADVKIIKWCYWYQLVLIEPNKSGTKLPIQKHLLTLHWNISHSDRYQLCSQISQ